MNAKIASSLDRISQFKGLIFDMDGTLIHSGAVHEQAWRNTLEHFGLPIDPDFMRRMAGMPTAATLQKILDELGGESSADVQTMADYREDQLETLGNDDTSATPLIELVRHFAGKLPMAVGTGGQPESAKALLADCGFEDSFAHVVGASEIDHPKPAPDTFLRCAELLNVAPEDCAVFEDAELGLEAARKAGMTPIDVGVEYGIVFDYFLE